MNEYYKANGEYAVGTSCFSITDQTREETLNVNQKYRKIAVRLYYPADLKNVEGKKRAAIFTQRGLEALKLSYRVKNAEQLDNEADFYENVNPIDKACPLVFFNQGYQGFIEQNTALCLDLAAHGFIVASVGHANESMINEYEDGSYDVYDKALNKKIMQPMMKALFAQMRLLKKNCSYEEAVAAFDVFQKKYAGFTMNRVVEWHKDTMSVLNELKQRNQDEHFILHNRIDFAKGIAATGHSLGGATAYHLCMYEPEFVCGINMDGALFGEYDDCMMEKPFMTIGCTGNRNVEMRAMIATHAPAYYASFQQMKHLGFSDAKSFLNVKNLVGTLPLSVARTEVTNLHLQFLKKHFLLEAVDSVGTSKEYMTFEEK